MAKRNKKTARKSVGKTAQKNVVGKKAVKKPAVKTVVKPVKVKKQKPVVEKPAKKEKPVIPESKPHVPKVYQNFNRNIRIDCFRTPTKVLYCSSEYDSLELMRESIDVFDTEFKPIDYDVKIAAKKMLESRSRFIHTDANARAVLEAISEGKTPDPKLFSSAPIGTSSGASKKSKSGGNGRKPGSGAFIRELILEGKYDDETIVKMTHKQFPDSKCSVKDVGWNKGKLKRDGIAVPVVK